MIEVSATFWIGFLILVLFLLSLDMFVFHKKGERVKVKKALWLSLFWISLALMFNVGIYFVFGKESAIEFFTAYLIEESLSIDNLFVFIIIFATFKIDLRYQHDVLFWGILGAIIFRAIFIFAGVALIERFGWIMYIFGAFLAFTGLKMAIDLVRERKGKQIEKVDISKNKIIRFFMKIIPTTDDISEVKFFKKIDGKLVATPFFIALLVIEMTDIIFAVDSIPAVLSVSTNTFIVYTSNIFAILGLRSFYFALRGIMDIFYYLKYTLSIILIFIGAKMILNHHSEIVGSDFHISNATSLIVIASLLAISIVASILRSKHLKNKTHR
ncbi:MAG TPA: TerC family protein [Dysgonamonadaceae bacterium]|nr:TerC family protein [Dysgonamonadaceae bacterium]HOT64664.1 TerC family protein [Dysgonamonadaceae bacterium]HOV35379.1 TerC family protein [Dysgonamonadaceae bacterium]HPD43048.1 TerC family protein [Dysgonamonadaceae bacterium]HQG07127.1 TerC family protein [Dysgonamonadaceae bacterium]